MYLEWHLPGRKDFFPSSFSSFPVLPFLVRFLLSLLKSSIHPVDIDHPWHSCKGFGNSIESRQATKQDSPSLNGNKNYLFAHGHYSCAPVGLLNDSERFYYLLLWGNISWSCLQPSSLLALPAESPAVMFSWEEREAQLQ